MDVEAVPISSGPGSADLPATVDGGQVVTESTQQVVQACEVLWMVQLDHRRIWSRFRRMNGRGWRRPLDQAAARGIINRKLLLYASRMLPAENMPHIEENLVDPFLKQEIPLLMKQFKVDSRPELGGASPDRIVAGGCRADLDDRGIASESMRKQIKVNEEIRPISEDPRLSWAPSDGLRFSGESALGRVDGAKSPICRVRAGLRKDRGIGNELRALRQAAIPSSRYSAKWRR